MKIILTPNQMRKIDSIAINEFSITGSILMENAAANSSIKIKYLFQKNGIINPEVSIFCGSGNNGGDGFALARHLLNFCSVKIYWIGDESKMSEETKQNFNICQKLGIGMIHLNNVKDCNFIDLKSDCVIDALIGVGGSENVRGIALDLLKILSNFKGLKIAIDVPTGLNSENGMASEFAFKADYTITMFAPKTGMLLNKGFDYCGKILIANLGVPISLSEGIANNFVLDWTSASMLLPKRKKISSKFDYGKVIILAGSKQYPGAAALTANSAIKSGAGLVYLLSTYFHPKILPEVIPVELKSNADGTISRDSMNIIEDYINKADSIVVGPGLSNNLDTIELIRDILKSYGLYKKFVIDADGLRAIQPDIDLSNNICLTPHTGEFKRLIRSFDENFPLPDNKLNDTVDYYEILSLLSKKIDSVIHLKWVPSITSNGKKFYWNLSGNPGMATGGSGDVLSGIIGALLAQGMDTLEGTALASFIHSKAGDFAAKLISINSISASDIMNFIPIIFMKLENINKNLNSF